MSNKIAVQNGVGTPFEIKETEIHTPGKGEIVVKETYAASNYMDPMIQKFGFPLIKSYPVALGMDFTGIVEAVGEGATKFKKGDRVHGITSDFPNFDLKHGAFQQYCVTKDVYAGHIPNNVSDEIAVTFCAPIMTAFSAIHKDLNIPFPPLEKNPPKNGKVIFVNSAGSGVGAAAVLLCKMSGYEVIATASPHNFEFVKEIGATHVFDYKDPSLLEKIKQSLNGKIPEYSLDCFFSPSTLQISFDVLNGSGTCMTAFSLDTPNVQAVKIDMKGSKHIFMYMLRLFDDVQFCNKYWEWIHSALEKNLLVTIKPEVVGHGVEEAQKLIDFHGSGKLSATKPILKI